VTEESEKQATAPDEHAQTRAAFESWQRGPVEAEKEYVLPPPRSAFPPSFLAILAAGCLVLAAEPTADLPYELCGPSQAIDLGRPGAYSLDKAADGTRARLQGYAGSLRGSFALFGTNYEVAPLIGIPVLVRRAPHPQPPPDSAETYQGEGRLVRLQDTPSSYFERLFDPAARYSTTRLQFQALGVPPFGRPAWLLVEGDLPRKDLWAIAEPILLWMAAAAFAGLAWRSHRTRARAAALKAQTWRSL